MLHIDEAPDFAERAGLWAAKAATALLADHALTEEDVDLIVAAPLTPTFLDALRVNLGAAEDRITAPSPPPGAHTAALLFALAHARETGRLSAARHTLMVTAGGGITAGAALLRSDERTCT